MPSLPGPSCKNNSTIWGHLSKAGKLPPEQTWKGWAVAQCCSSIHGPGIQSQQGRPIDKNPETQRRANMDGVWDLPIPHLTNMKFPGENNSHTDQSREPNTPMQQFPKVFQTQVHFLGRNQNGPANSWGKVCVTHPRLYVSTRNGNTLGGQEIRGATSLGRA